MSEFDSSRENQREAASLAFAALAAFLGRAPLTESIGDLERQLQNADGDAAAELAARAGFDADSLRAALIVKQEMGRVNDAVHALAITLALPQILEPGERLTNRPSLGAGNDPSRPFDLETTHRVAEFKLARWTGHDTMRGRMVTADLVNLAMDGSERRPELWVVGPKPIHFLRTSKTTVDWQLGRSSRNQHARYRERYDSSLTVAQFTAGPAAHVRLCDISEIVPVVEELLG